MTDAVLRLEAGLWNEDHNESAEREFVEQAGRVDDITVGTILEYDDWQWACVSRCALDREQPMLGFILLDELGDDIHKRLETAVGCRQHYAAVQEFRQTDHEYWTSVEYVENADVWAVLGPVHPDARKNGGDE